MTCNWTASRLSAYLDSELGGEEMLRVQEHLRLCPCCAQELEALRTIKSSLAQLAEGGPDADFEERLIAHVMSGAMEARRPARPRWPMLAAAGIAVAIGSYMVMRAGDQPVPVRTPQLVEADPSAVWAADPLSGQVPIVSAASYNR